jgi:phage baseplate assembly protein V
MTAEDLAQLSHLLRPLHVRVANLAARATVQLVDDSGKLQTLQIGGIHGGPYDGCEHLQPYGISGVPPAGSEAIVVFPNGDRLHPLVFAVGDRASRPTGGAAGDFTVYNAAGARITLLATGDIDVHPAPGGKVRVHGGGATDALVTQQQFVNHTHLTAGTGPATPPTAISPTPTLTGTTVLEAQ